MARTYLSNMFGMPAKGKPSKQVALFLNEYDFELVISQKDGDTKSKEDWTVLSSVKFQRQDGKYLRDAFFFKFIQSVRKGTYKMQELTDTKNIADEYSPMLSDNKFMRLQGKIQVTSQDGKTRRSKVYVLSIYKAPNGYDDMKTITFDRDKGIYVIPEHWREAYIELNTFTSVYGSWSEKWEDDILEFAEALRVCSHTMIANAYTHHMEAIRNIKQDAPNSNSNSNTDNVSAAANETKVTPESEWDDEFPF